MDPFSLPHLAALLKGAYRLFDGLTSFIHPIAGTSSAALAISIPTGIVRAFLVPVGASQVKAEGTRRRFYPQLIELQRRYRRDPVSLQQKTAEFYRGQNSAQYSSQFAGLLPALAQAPALSVVCTLFARVTSDGHANALFDHQLFSATLSGSFLQISAGGGGSILVYLVLFAAIVPLAAALYLAASATWALGERVLLRRWY